MSEPTKLLTPKQVGEMLQLSLATVSRMASTGQIPHIVLKAGRRKRVIRFRAEEIEGWLRERTHGGTAGHRPKRKEGRIGNGVATDKALNSPTSQPVELQRENGEYGEGHRFEQPVSGV